MNVTRFAIEKNRVTLVLITVLAVWGLQSFANMPQAEDPGFTIRVALVMTYFPGASPERVEQLVTDKLEKAIQEIPELDFVAASRRPGCRSSTSTSRALQEHAADLGQICGARSNGPGQISRRAFIGPIVNDEFGDVFGTIVTVTGDGFTYAELKEIADEVRDELLMIPDAAKVEISGDQEERIFVEYSNARLADLGLSPLQLKKSSREPQHHQPGWRGAYPVRGNRPRADRQLRVGRRPAADRDSSALERRSGLSGGCSRDPARLHRSTRVETTCKRTARLGSGNLAA